MCSMRGRGDGNCTLQTHLRRTKRRTHATPSMPHREYPHLVSERDVVDVVPSAFQEDATCIRCWGLPIQAADVGRVADDVERCSQFLCEQVW
jgi:hypothetical protein